MASYKKGRCGISFLWGDSSPGGYLCFSDPSFGPFKGNWQNPVNEGLSMCCLQGEEDHFHSNWHNLQGLIKELQRDEQLHMLMQWLMNVSDSLPLVRWKVPSLGFNEPPCFVLHKESSVTFWAHPWDSSDCFTFLFFSPSENYLSSTQTRIGIITWMMEIQTEWKAERFPMCSISLCKRTNNFIQGSVA